MASRSGDVKAFGQMTNGVKEAGNCQTVNSGGGVAGIGTSHVNGGSVKCKKVGDSLVKNDI